MVGPRAKRKALTFVRSKFLISIRQGCRILGLQGSTAHYKPKRVRDDTDLKQRIQEVVKAKPNWGRPNVIWKLKTQDKIPDNHKRISRIYRELGLQMNKREKSRKRKRGRLLLEMPTRPNQLWAMDFVSDSFSSGRKFRVLAVKDLFTHESICLWADVSIPGERVAEQLERIGGVRGALASAIVCDNGPEFTCKAMDQWCYKRGVTQRFIQPGKPTQNAFIESFNGKFRMECLNRHWFESLDEARKIIEDWRIEYNTDRPNSALGKKTPEQFAREYGAKLCS